MTTHDFLQATNKTKPTLIPADVQWNRADSATFDGTRVMASADVGKILGSKRASTVFIVVEGGTQTTQYPSIIRADSGSSKIDVYGKELDDGYFRVKQYDTNRDEIGDCVQVVPNINQKSIVCFVNRGMVGGVDGGATLYINSIDDVDTDSTFNTSDYDVDLDDAITYFGDNDALGTDAFVGSFPCAPIIFDRALSDSEIETAFDTLWKTYGVGCWEYDGSTSETVVAHPADNSLDLDATNWTVSFWVKFDGSRDGESQYIVSLGGSYDANNSLTVYSSGANKYGLCVEDGAGNSTADETATAYADSREWKHICIIREGNTVTGYVNGAVDGWSADVTSVGAVDVSGGSYGNLTIGTRGDGDNDKRVGGYLRDFAIFNDRAISGAELAALAAGEYAADATGGAPDVNLVMLPDYATGTVTVGVTPALTVTNTAVTGTNQA